MLNLLIAIASGLAGAVTVTFCVNYLRARTGKDKHGFSEILGLVGGLLGLMFGALTVAFAPQYLGWTVLLAAVFAPVTLAVFSALAWLLLSALSWIFGTSAKLGNRLGRRE